MWTTICNSSLLPSLPTLNRTHTTSLLSKINNSVRISMKPLCFITHTQNWCEALPVRVWTCNSSATYSVLISGIKQTFSPSTHFPSRQNQAHICTHTLQHGSNCPWGSACLTSQFSVIQMMSLSVSSVYVCARVVFQVPHRDDFK